VGVVIVGLVIVGVVIVGPCFTHIECEIQTTRDGHSHMHRINS